MIAIIARANKLQKAAFSRLNSPKNSPKRRFSPKSHAVTKEESLVYQGFQW